MPTQSKLLIWLVVALTVASVALTFWRTMVSKDFTIVDDVEAEDIEADYEF